MRRAGAVAEEARYVDMPNRGHYMLAGARDWNAAAVRESLGVLSRVHEAN